MRRRAGPEGYFLPFFGAGFFRAGLAAFFGTEPFGAGFFGAGLTGFFGAGPFGAGFFGAGFF